MTARHPRHQQRCLPPPRARREWRRREEAREGRCCRGTPSSPPYHHATARSGAPVIVWRSALKSVILDVLRARPGWREAADGEPWDFFWAEKG